MLHFSGSKADENSFLCSLYKVICTVYSVGQAIGSVSTSAERIVHRPNDPSKWTYGDEVYLLLFTINNLFSV